MMCEVNQSSKFGCVDQVCHNSYPRNGFDINASLFFFLLLTLIVKVAAGLLIVYPKDAIFKHECD